ncbi:MAG TPA: dihydrofolate reductase family protein [Longimicrobium sp.]|nr:dihydrofolate reductase family protein [Longimicrobium sp.]
MRKVVAAAFVSLDGVMQAPGGPPEDPTGGFECGGWLVPYSDEATGQFVMEAFSTPFDLLLGRRTYDIFAAHWPFMPDGDPIREAFDRVTKYVATRSGMPLTWQNSVRLEGDAADAVRRLKQEDGPMLLTQGSSVLLQTLFAHDLVDELRVLTFPLVLGRGKRFFTEGAMPGALTLTDTRVSSTGVIMSVYERAGEVKVGSFMLPEPSQAELERRERMKREG